MDAVGAPLDAVWAKSSFEEFVDQAKCEGCQFEAITMVKPAATNGARRASKKLKAQVDPDKCWGCGVCVVGCDETNAMGFRRVRSMEAVPA